MDIKTIQKLRDLDNAFYRDNHASFSQTRSQAWKGWDALFAYLPQAPASVLDVACGNMRFKAFLEERIDTFAYYGVDACTPLVPDSMRGSFEQLDLIEELEAGTLLAHLEAPECDLTACFGFMHHVPSHALRSALMRALVDKTVGGGTIAVSFWQFALDESRRRKAQETTRLALQTVDVDLEEGDYLLGWQNKPGAYRYCHSFDDGEVAQLLDECGDAVRLVDRFSADGKTGDMNAYIVLRKLRPKNLYNHLWPKRS